jgi:hypothetical protein
MAFKYSKVNVIYTPSASPSSVLFEIKCMESVKFNFSHYFGVALGFVTLLKANNFALSNVRMSHIWKEIEIVTLIG